MSSEPVFPKAHERALLFPLEKNDKFRIWNVAVTMFDKDIPVISLLYHENIEQLDKSNPYISELGKHWVEIERYVSEYTPNDLRVYLEHASMFRVKRIDLKKYL